MAGLGKLWSSVVYSSVSRVHGLTAEANGISPLCRRTREVKQSLFNTRTYNTHDKSTSVMNM